MNIPSGSSTLIVDENEKNMSLSQNNYHHARDKSENRAKSRNTDKYSQKN